MVQDLVETTICEEEAFFLRNIEDVILHFEYKDDTLITLDHVKSAYRLYEIHSDNNKMKVLLSFGAFSSITPQARQYAENKVMPTPAQAIIIKNLAQRMLAKFYQIFRKDVHPLKFFAEHESAVEWLEEH